MGDEAVPKRQYTEEFRLEAFRLAASVGSHEAARRLGIPIATLGNWCRRSRKAPGKETTESAPGGHARRSPTDLEAENTGFARNLLAPGWTSKFSERQRHTSRSGRGEVCLD